MCMDELDSKGRPVDLKLYGQPGSDFKNIEMNLVPCKPTQLTPQNAKRAKTECIYNLKSPRAVRAYLDETKKYMKSPHIN